jgi:hypothetical protein
MKPRRWPLVVAATLLVVWNVFLLTMVLYGNK